jgi:hypothetical protein
MPHLAPLVGYCTNRGLLYCLPCAQRLDIALVETHGAMLVYADNAAFATDCCEGCDKPLVPHDEEPHP